jgi:hypothetical protein
VEIESDGRHDGIDTVAVASFEPAFAKETTLPSREAPFC